MRISGVTYSVRKTHKARNTILTVSILLLLLAFAVAIISAYSGWKLLHPEKKDIAAFTSNIVPEYRDITFTGRDKSVQLKGWFFQLKDSGRTVILAHSYGKNRLEFGEKSVNMIKSFLDNGYNVFTFDFRNSGQSDGKYTTMGYYEKEDIQAAIKYVSEQGSKQIVLMGFSTGASACLLAAEEQKVTAVIADSPYAGLKSYLDKDLNKWTGLPAFPFNYTVLYAMEAFTGMQTANADAVKYLDSMSPCPLLLIHGKGDELISVENSRELHSVYSGYAADKAEIWETDSQGNAASYLADPEKYMDRVLEFLEKVSAN